MSFLYSEPTVLRDWLCLTVPGGLITFTHKATVAEIWQPEQDRLEHEVGLWEEVYISEDIDYLPSLKVEPGKEYEEKAKVYIYRKI